MFDEDCKVIQFSAFYDVFEPRNTIGHWRIGFRDAGNDAASLQGMRNIVSDRHLALLKRGLEELQIQRLARVAYPQCPALFLHRQRVPQSATVSRYL